MTRLTFVATVVCGFFGTANVASAAPHKDETFGYRIVAPPGWEQLPVKDSERWIVARFRSSKPYAVNDELGNVGSFKADMCVIVLSHEKPEDEDEVERTRSLQLPARQRPEAVLADSGVADLRIRRVGESCGHQQTGPPRVSTERRGTLWRDEGDSCRQAANGTGAFA